MIKKPKVFISIDPAGNWNATEKGGTGLACYALEPNNFSDTTIWAKDFNYKKDYYAYIKKVIDILSKPNRDDTLVVIEDFKLEASKAGALGNKTMETSELIAILEEYCDSLGIKHFRQPNTVKSRWKKPLILEELEELGFPDYKVSSRHAWDAIRHLLSAYFFGWKKEKNYEK